MEKNNIKSVLITDANKNTIIITDPYYLIDFQFDDGVSKKGYWVQLITLFNLFEQLKKDSEQI